MITDFDLYYRIGFNILAYRHEMKAMFGGKYDTHPKDMSKFDVVKWANEKLEPFLDGEKEIIKRDDWDLDGLKGATSGQILHPHFDIMKTYFFDSHKVQSSTAVIMLCSSKKPYRTNHVINYFYKLAVGRVDFYIISNPGVIPIGCDNHYPFRWYEWPEKEETEEIKVLYYQIIKQRLEEWFNMFHYDTIISVVRPGETLDSFNSADIKGTRKINVFNDENLGKLKEEYMPRFKNWGLMKFRLLNLKTTKAMFIKELDHWELNL